MTPDALTFSVVIPAYNAAETLAEAVDSVLAQTLQDFEIIVVDDGSSDDTAAVAASFEDQRVRLYSQPNAGPSAARNRGIAHATGEYVSLLDSDDLLLPDYLAEMSQALEEHPQAGFAYTHAFTLDVSSNRFRTSFTGSYHMPRTPMLPRDELAAELLAGNFLQASSTVIRRAVLERVGGYDDSLSHGEDWELWLRIANSGFQAVRVAGPLTVARSRPGSRGTEAAPMAAAPRAVYLRVLERHRPSPSIRALAEAELKAMDRRARADMRVLLSIRRTVGALTRGLRVRYIPSNRRHLRATPPLPVAKAFPGLGIGRPVSSGERLSVGYSRARRETPQRSTGQSAAPLSGEDVERTRAEPGG
jgi:glycosyltransferase involved in cell wall biosynthesis